MEFSLVEKDEILVKTHYSSLNYKDALSASGNKGVTRNYPHTTGIDAVGVIETSGADSLVVGDILIVTSYDLGMNTDGEFAEYIKVPSAWAVKLPENNLIGIDSQNYPMKFRIKVWDKLEKGWKPTQLPNTCKQITLAEIQDKIDLMLQGKLKGITIIRIT